MTTGGGKGTRRRQELAPLILEAWNREDQPTAGQLEREFHTGRHLVRSVLLEAGINPSRRRQRPPSPQRQAATAAILEAWARPDRPTIAQISEELGVSHYIVRTALLDAGHNTRERSGTNQPGPRPLDPGLVEQVVAAWNETPRPTVSRIGQRLGVHRTKVLRALAEAGVHVPPQTSGPPRITPDQRAHILHAWARPDRPTQDQLAAELGIGRTTVNRVVAEAKATGELPSRRDRIATAWTQARIPDAQAIATDHGVTVHTVHQVVAERGLPTATQIRHTRILEAWNDPAQPTLAQIAAGLGITAGTVRRVVTQARAPQDAPPHQGPSRTQRILAAWTQAYIPDPPAIAAAHRITTPALTAIIRTHGLPPARQVRHQRILEAWNRPDRPTIAQVAHQTGTTSDAVHTALDEAGVPASRRDHQRGSAAAE